MVPEQLFSIQDSPTQFLEYFPKQKVELYLKREDLLHSEISGNKYRKLKYNFISAVQKDAKVVITFGGAFSNHIAATAAAGQKLGISTFGFIRGEELASDLEKTFNENETLKFARSCGMDFNFMSREDYRKKSEPKFLRKLAENYPDSYLIPEGGTNALAVKGCAEILNSTDKEFDYICCSAGTGGTAAGIINSSEENSQIIVFSALKGDFLQEEISKYTTKSNWTLNNNYHFGGYAKVTRDLIEFMNAFHQKHQILLDPVYTGKLLFGIIDMIKKSEFPENSRILAVHSGGLQGIAGMNEKLKKKNLPQINL